MVDKLQGRILAASEPVRGLLNYAALHFDRELFHSQDLGHGAPLMVLPGFKTTDIYTNKLRQYLTDLNFTVYGWGQGKNQARYSQYQGVKRELVRIYENHKEPVRLIGYSLGGLYARKLAQDLPHLVESVITVGTPVSWDIPTDSIRLLTLWGIMSGSDPDLIDYLSDVDWDPRVQTTIIYSQEDGVVHWQDTQNKLPSDRVKHIRVSGAHMGMIHNASVWRVIRQVYEMSQ